MPAKKKTETAKTIKITLTKSTNGRLVAQKATAEALGLRRIGDVTVQPDNPQTRGKIAKIAFMLRVEELV